MLWPEHEAGEWTLNKDTDDDYCHQIVAEEIVETPAGKFIWVLKNRDNHYLDCEVNALAAALTLNAHTLTDKSFARKSQLPTSKPPKPIAERRPGGFDRR